MIAADRRVEPDAEALLTSSQTEPHIVGDFALGILIASAVVVIGAEERYVPVPLLEHAASDRGQPEADHVALVERWLFQHHANHVGRRMTPTAIALGIFEHDVEQIGWSVLEVHRADNIIRAA